MRAEKNIEIRNRIYSRIINRLESENMARHGEWNQKGATLSDTTAKKEYGVDREFIIKGIQTGKLEYRDGSIWGNPYLRILRRQLEDYIVEEFGEDYLTTKQDQTELRKIKKEIRALKKRLKELQARRVEIEEEISEHIKTK